MNRNVNSTSKHQPSTSNSNKPKKTGKDRDRRKSQLEQQQQTTPEKNNVSPSKESSYTRQYAGISGDSIALYAEQTSEERFTEDVCDRLAEDINYKLRQIIHTAMVKARLSGRSAVIESDIDETFNFLNLGKMYGAPSNPEFIPFGDEGLYYLNDAKVNLIDISEQEMTYIQPNDAKIERSWYSVEAEKTENRETFFKEVCELLIRGDREETLLALHLVETNCRIGSIIDWFYNFAYFLLSYHSSCQHLTICAYSLIESLEGNPITDTSVSERQLSLLARLLLQKVFTLSLKSNFLRYTCTTLALLCRRIELKKLVFAILKEKSAKIEHTHTLSFLILITSMGADAVQEFFLPHIDDFFNKAQQDCELQFELMAIYNVICKHNLDHVLYRKYFKTFHETLCLYSNPSQMLEEIENEISTGFDRFILSVIHQKNYITMTVNLMKTRRKVQITVKVPAKIDMDLIFERSVMGTKIKFAGNSIKNINLSEKSKKIYEERKKAFVDKNNCILIGRTTLLNKIFQNAQHEYKKSKCCDHILRNYNL